MSWIDLIVRSAENFRVVTALVFLAFKIVARAYIRLLVQDPDYAVIGESFAGLGVDLGLLGASLIVGALCANKLTLSGGFGGLICAVLTICTVFCLLSYGHYHKATGWFNSAFAMSISWFTGSVPFWMALGILSQTTKVVGS